MLAAFSEARHVELASRLVIIAHDPALSRRQLLMLATAPWDFFLLLGRLLPRLQPRLFPLPQCELPRHKPLEYLHREPSRKRRTCPRARQYHPSRPRMSLNETLARGESQGERDEAKKEGSCVAAASPSRARSERSPSAVVRCMIARGIPAERTQILAKGETNPAVPAERGVPEPQNRRVEITWR